MKKLLPLIILAFSVGVADAQIPEFGIAPNLILTDIEGNTIDLYAKLDEGKPVVIDLFATWCGPCWTYHQGHALQNLWTSYGPSGTDELFVMAIESQAGNTIDQINGITGNPPGQYNTATQGNWLNGISYPMVDNSQPANLFNLEFFPTIVTVCPDRSVTETGTRSTAAHYSFASNCAGASTLANDRALIAYTGDKYMCADVKMGVALQNKGTSTLTSATIKVMDGSTEISSYAWSGNLAPYAYAKVNLGSVAVPGPGNYTIVISENDDYNTNNTFPVTLLESPLATLEVTIEVTTDNYPGETSWTLKKGSGATVASASYTAGPGQAGAGGPDANITHTHPATLVVNECYTFKIKDSYGDGMTFPSTGVVPGYRVLNSAGAEIVSGDGEFATDRSSALKTDESSGVNDAEGMVSGVQVYPNPATDNAMVTFSITDQANISIEIMNALGAKVFTRSYGTKAAGTQMIPLSVSDLSNGVYMVNILAGDATITKRLSVQR